MNKLSLFEHEPSCVLPLFDILTFENITDKTIFIIIKKHSYSSLGVCLCCEVHVTAWVCSLSLALDLTTFSLFQLTLAKFSMSPVSFHCVQ